MPRLRPLLVALAISALPGCSLITGSDGKLTTIMVAGERVDCAGTFVTRCLQVKTDLDSDQWTAFYDPIEGFDWEPGYEYVLLVSVHTIDNPPADGSSLEYHLVSVLQKRPDSRMLPGAGT